MKKLLIGLLALTSVSSFADTSILNAFNSDSSVLSDIGECNKISLPVITEIVGDAKDLSGDGIGLFSYKFLVIQNLGCYDENPIGKTVIRVIEKKINQIPFYTYL
jgi:hypothetical protein